MPSPISNRFRNPDSLGKLGFVAFSAFGAVNVVVGIFLAFDDPGGFAVIVFGLFFIGAGYLARKLFTAPPGQKSIVIEESAFQTTRLDGRGSSVASGTVIHVDENADAEAIEAAKAAWAAKRYAAGRPDWATGQILAEGERRGGLYKWAAIVWGGFALAALAAALTWGDIAWFILAGAAPISGLIAFQAIRDRARRRKFGRSLFLMQDPPARLGGPFEGVVQTSIPYDRMPQGGFSLKLSCIRRWEESAESESGPGTRQRSEPVWTDTATAAAEAGKSSGLSATVRFDLPADAAPTTLGQLNTGYVWELSVTAEMDGLDYQARFQAPVLDPDMRI